LAKNDKGSRRSAKVGDVIELSYQVFLEDGKQIDGVQKLAPAGKTN
jgi:hypothetical protein